MIPISDEVRKVLSQRLKLGERALPNIRVEVDRLAFIPGRTEEFRYVTTETKETVSVKKVWVQESTDGVYDGETTAEGAAICFPVQGKTIDTITISDRFGTARDGGARSHKGIDLFDDMGTPILAAWSGKVVNITRKRTEGQGFSVNIKHANGLMTKYFHLSEINCSLDDVVSQGQVIGKLGNTGAVYTNGHRVTEAERAAGKGRHLHFEVWEGVNQDSRVGEGGKAVDPLPYLKGAKKLYSDAKTLGKSVVDEGFASGYPGEIKLSENFDKRNWYEKDVYKLSWNFRDFASVQTGWTLYDSGGKLVYTFGVSSATVEFEIDVSKLSMPTEGLFSIGFGTNFTGMSQGDSLSILMDDKAYAYVAKFEGDGGMTKLTELKNIAIPAGTKTIKVQVIYGGKMNAAPPPGGYGPPARPTVKKFAIDYIRIQELLPTPPNEDDPEAEIDPSKGHWEELEYPDFITTSKTNKEYLQVGSFVYMDTQVLPNIISCEIDDQYEAESREARLTISNPRGYYSPDYNPAYFPETAGLVSPWSYFVNGFHIGVLSENTPIRIYMGYGQHLIRMFTGLIDKVDMNAESTLDITARDMYKKAIEKVITEKKAYPEVDEIDNVPDPLPAAPSSDRKTQIIQAAQTQAAAYGIPDHKFLLAICRHETVLGTQGMGTEENGSFILGYGCYSRGYCDPKYKGIQEQMKRGAERMSKALASRGKKVTSKADVLYFHEGGDIAPMVWSGDRDNWVDKVWMYYQEMLANPSAWTVTATSTPSVPVPKQPVEFEKPAWVKSSVVVDLIKHAGLIGWRATSEDLAYPDYVVDETYLVEVNQRTGRVIVPIPDKEGEFEVKEASSILTPNGWLNPFVEEYGKTFEQYSTKVADAINEIISEIPYRSYCDRYGTYRLERINYNKPVVAEFSENDNLISITKSIDWSRGRSHIVVLDADGKPGQFVDKEILLELKGEIRTAVLNVPWAKSKEAKRQVAERAFFDMKRLCRTLQVSIPANPALDLLDNVIVTDKTTTTRSVYTIKGIRTSYSVDTGMLQVIDLMWSKKGVMV